MMTDNDRKFDLLLYWFLIS